MDITSPQEMAAAAIASGTHRINIVEVDTGRFKVGLVPREEPDPDMMYMKKGEKQGPFVVCPTPFTTPEGHEIEIILIREASSPVGFNVLVNFPNQIGQQNFVPFDPRK